MKIMTKLAARLGHARNALREVHAEARGWVEAHAEALARRAALLSSLQPVEDVVAGAEWFAEKAEAALLERGAEFRSLAGGFGMTYASPDVPVPTPPKLPDLPLPALSSWEVQAGYDKARFVAFVREAVTRTPYTAGPPLAGRPRLLAELDAEIAEIEANHTAIVDAAAALDPPLVIPLLDTVHARRHGLAARQDRAADEHSRFERANSVALRRRAAEATALEARQNDARRLQEANREQAAREAAAAEESQA